MQTSGEDDAPLYVPAEFEAEHLDEARRRVARTRGSRRLVHRTAAAVTGGGDRSPRRRALRFALFAVHVLATAFTLAISALTGTWFVGLTVTALITVSFLAIMRTLTAVDLTDLGSLADPGTHRESHPPR